MSAIPRPKPCYLDDFKVDRVVGGSKIWKNQDGDRYFTWDSLHGEIEVFNTRGRHLGAADPVSGVMIKPAVKGRTINLD